MLKVLDPNDEIVAARFIQGRTNAEFLLPVKPNVKKDFRLRVDTGGRRIPSDPRILNFRVFRIDLN